MSYRALRPVARCLPRLRTAAACLTIAMVLAAWPLGAVAQERPARGANIPADVVADVDAVFNAPLTRRVIGPATVGAGDVIGTDLAVLDGPLVIAGRVAGSVLAVNAPVRLEPGASIGGTLLIVGGQLEQLGDARVEGRVRVYPTRLGAQWDGSRLTITGAPTDTTDTGDVLAEWWERMRRRNESSSGFTVTSSGTYNRVEGLAMMAGPRLRRPVRRGAVTVEALGIARTAESLKWDSENLGHLVTAEVELGGPARLTIGGQLHDVVVPTEHWSLSDSEVGLASFLAQRDFRDYYERHGGEVYAGMTHGDLRLRMRLAQERWGMREARSVLALFSGSHGWRPNPLLDEGRVTMGAVSLRLDTRNRPQVPWSGWYLSLEYEAGRGRLTRATLVPGSDDAPDTDGAVAGPLDGRTEWGRALLDVRHYARISPSAQINARLVLGGWLHGDPLPLQRRLGLGGPGSLPGYDFREPVEGSDPLACSTHLTSAGGPALCDRIVLAQLDYKGDVPAPRVRSLEPYGWPTAMQWVVFANAGRGWLVDRGPGDLRASSGAIPGVGSWLADVGAGVEIGPLGLYVAKAVSTPGRGANLFLRLGQRF